MNLTGVIWVVINPQFYLTLVLPTTLSLPILSIANHPQLPILSIANHPQFYLSSVLPTTLSITTCPQYY